MGACHRSLSALLLALTIGCGARSSLSTSLEVGDTSDGCPNDAACDAPPPFKSAVAVSMGHSHACAVTRAGAVWCWGFNGYGQLGNGSVVDSAIPVPVVGLSSGVLSVAAGWYHTCVVTQAAEVKCWGRNESGQLGNDSNLDSSVPVTVRALSVSAVSAGLDHTCAITQAGDVECWGQNSVGQLGNDFSSQTLGPFAVQGLSSRVAALAAGAQYSCVVSIDGAVHCFGNGGSGQLGEGRTASSELPVLVVGLPSGAMAVTAGDSHTCALTSLGGVKCWGDNIYGELGPNVPRNGSATPVDIQALPSGVVAITAGTNQTCVIDTGGAVRCWGDGDHGQLGNGSVLKSETPVAAAGLSSGVVAISAGTLHACAVTAAGQVYCWGYNPYGELGDGSKTDRAVPVRVVGF